MGSKRRAPGENTRDGCREGISAAQRAAETPVGRRRRAGGGRHGRGGRGHQSRGRGVARQAAAGAQCPRALPLLLASLARVTMTNSSVRLRGFRWCCSSYMTKLKWFRDRATRVSLATSALTQPSICRAQEEDTWPPQQVLLLACSGSAGLSWAPPACCGPRERTAQRPRASHWPLGAQPLGRDRQAGQHPCYLQHAPHLLGGDGHQPPDAALLQLALLLDDLLEDSVDVDFALSGNLGNKYGGWGGPGQAVGPGSSQIHCSPLPAGPPPNP